MTVEILKDLNQQNETNTAETKGSGIQVMREQGAINNQTLRQLTASDVLTASQELRRLRDLDLIQQRGKGSATYYLPGPRFPTKEARHTTLAPQHTTLGAPHATLPGNMPPTLKEKIAALGGVPASDSDPFFERSANGNHFPQASWRRYLDARMSKQSGETI